MFPLDPAVRRLSAPAPVVSAAVIDGLGRDAEDRPVSSGVYFYRMDPQGQAGATGRVAVIR